jgi:N-formylmaleamate deformylase
MTSTFRYGAHVHANGIRQHYLRYGPAGSAASDTSGTPRASIILIPGITSPAPTWGFVAETLGTWFDTYVLDVRGRGLSEASATMDYSLDAQAADVIAFAEALALGSESGQYALVGHSMGARIAIRAARSAPVGLACAVLVDPPVSGPGRRPYPAQLPWYVDSIRQAAHGIGPEAMRAFCPTWTEEQLRMRAQWLHTCDERAMLTSFEGFHTDDIHADLPSLNVPSLLVSAARGDVVMDADVAEMQALVPHLLHVRVADAGHMIPWDNEAGFYDAISGFLKTNLPNIV